MNKLKIIFISHTYPPTVGGVETQNFELAKWLSKDSEVTIIANTRGRKFLPIFAIYALLKSLILLHKNDVVILGSGMLAINGWIIKFFTKKPVISVVHGLDINYNSSSLGVWYEKLLIFIYQSLWTKIFIPKLDKLIAVGNETIRVGIRHGIHKDKFVFIPNGVDTEKHFEKHSLTELEKITNRSLENKKILLTTGRLAKRKGVAWFIENVLPELDNNFIYIVAGDGPDKKNILSAIEKSSQQERVLMLGYVSDELKNILWNTADLFIQANIAVPGDMEGFGISVIEAGSCELPVLASNLEGLKDAIKDNKNGFLVSSQDIEAFIEKINKLFADDSPRKIHGKKMREYVVENYHWQHIAKLYLNEITEMTSTAQESKL